MSRHGAERSFDLRRRDISRVLQIIDQSFLEFGCFHASAFAT
jgi:hypothetical protein